METNFSKRNITREKATALLGKQGIVINPEEMEVVMNFLYLLAEIFVNEIAPDEKS